MSESQTLHLSAPRPTARPEPHPAAIPPDAEIYTAEPDSDAERQLLGSQVDDIGLSWWGDRGDALGRAFVAVLPGDPAADMLRAHNRAVGGIVVQYG